MKDRFRLLNEPEERPLPTRQHVSLFDRHPPALPRFQGGPVGRVRFPRCGDVQTIEPVTVFDVAPPAAPPKPSAVSAGFGLSKLSLPR